jgi:hypothetical protein
VDEHQFDLTIFSVATDRYINYWSEMVESYLKTNDSELKVQWIVFTDKSEQINPDLISKLGNSLLIVETPHQKWPLPTLLRYKFFLSIADKVLGRVVMHLDADMLFLGELNFANLESALGQKGVALIKHPGYFRPIGIKKPLFYVSNLKYAAKDLKTYLRFGGLGTWERNKESKAFVPRAQRKNYVCGGTWLGRRKEISTLCKELSQRIDQDLAHGIVAIFHDESHLNWYQARNHFHLLDPDLCYDATYPQLRNLKPKIQAVNKNSDMKWIR